MADLNITLEEFDNVRNERDKALEEINQLKGIIEGLENKSRVIVTRYDRMIPDNIVEHMCKDLATQIWNQKRFTNNGFISHDPWGNPTDYTLNGVGVNIDPEDIMIQKCVDRIVKPFIQKYVNTSNNTQVVTNNTSIRNFEDVIDEIKSMYDTQFALEYGERVNTLAEQEASIAAKNKEADKKLKEAEVKFNKAEKQVQDIINNLRSDLDSAKKITRDKVQEIADLNADIRYLNKTISERDKTIESLNSEAEIYKETISTQKTKLNSIFNTWWWKIFG